MAAMRIAEIFYVGGSKHGQFVRVAWPPMPTIRVPRNGGNQMLRSVSDKKIKPPDYTYSYVEYELMGFKPIDCPSMVIFFYVAADENEDAKLELADRVLLGDWRNCRKQ